VSEASERGAAAFQAWSVANQPRRAERNQAVGSTRGIQTPQRASSRPDTALDHIRPFRSGFNGVLRRFPLRQRRDDGSKRRPRDHRSRQAHRVPAEHVAQTWSRKGEARLLLGLITGPTLPTCSSRICALSTSRSGSPARMRTRTASCTRLSGRSGRPTAAACSFVRSGRLTLAPTCRDLLPCTRGRTWPSKCTAT
jgi:hypothetical protein